MTVRRWELLRSIGTAVCLLCWAGIATYHYLGDSLSTAVLLGLLLPLALSIFLVEVAHQKVGSTFESLFNSLARTTTTFNSRSPSASSNQPSPHATSYLHNRQNPSAITGRFFAPIGKAVFPILIAYLADYWLEGANIFIPVAILLFLFEIWLDSRHQFNNARTAELTLENALKSSEWLRRIQLIESFKRTTGFPGRTHSWFMRLNALLGVGLLVVYGSLIGGFASSDLAIVFYGIASGVLLLIVTTSMLLVDIQSHTAAQLSAILEENGYG